MAASHATARAQRTHIERRAVILLATILGGALGLLVMSGLFLWPGDSARYVDAGHIDHFPPGTVTSFRIEEGRLYAADPPYQRVTATAGMHVVRLDDGQLVVFSWRSTHLGPAVHWETEYWSEPLAQLPGDVAGVFVDPAVGAVWLIDGTRVFGPAPRDLDRFAVEITEAGRVRIDVSRVIEGARTATSDPDATPTPALIVPGQ